MSFSDDVKAFARETERKRVALIGRVVDDVLESIKVGSAVTGAPGQPISQDKDPRTLIDSWFRNRIGPDEWLVGSKYFTAPWIEEGMLPSGRQFVLRSAVGGFHSVKLTAAAWPQLVENAMREVQ